MASTDECNLKSAFKQNSDKTVNWKALSAYTLNNTQCKKLNRKNETAVNFVKPKPKTAGFLQNRTENRTKVIFCQPHTPTNVYTRLFHQAKTYATTKPLKQKSKHKAILRFNSLTDQMKCEI